MQPQRRCDSGDTTEVDDDTEILALLRRSAELSAAQGEALSACGSLKHQIRQWGEQIQAALAQHDLAEQRIVAVLQEKSEIDVRLSELLSGPAVFWTVSDSSEDLLASCSQVYPNPKRL